MSGGRDLAVFVYGTLQPGGRYWARYGEGRVIEAQRARVRGCLYSLNAGYPAMAAPAGQSRDPWVRGWWLLLRDEAALCGFDELEDFDPARAAAENEYHRVRIACFTDDEAGTPLGEAWVYVMEPARVAALGGVELPAGFWAEAR